MENNEECYEPKLAENIFRKVKEPLGNNITMFLSEIQELLNKANAIIKLDYVLKDQSYIKKFGISPYLNTRIATSKSILYNGGYSKELYYSWCGYVREGRKNLAIKLIKYSEIIQSIWSWLSNFS